MASVTITIPDTVVQRVLDAYAALHGYNPATDGTKAQFLKASLIARLKDDTRKYEGSQAGSSAQQAAAAKADSEISIT